ncbi:MAG: class I SAM-dependent methyltransferase, partial [Chloroflexota bacterium]|nr:class I SAM-dependent methyltransferase [Chloroflexota bacterium]
ADTLKPERTVGLDNSENFLANVRTSASDNVSFRLHDITTAPFPEAPFDLIFSRLVLTHLQDPETAITLWTEQLRHGGLLLIEEVESIYTKVPALVTYLDIQQAMLAQQSNQLYIGPRLDAITASGKLHRRSSNVRTLQVPADRAAAMFHMNLGVWRHNDFVQQTYAPTTLDALDQDLQAIAQGHTDDPPVEWQLRQIVIERAAP